MRKTVFQFGLAVLILLAGVSCSSKMDPDWIGQTGLFADPEATQPTDTFGWRDIFYLLIELNSPPPDTIVQVSWIAVDTTRIQPDTVLRIEREQARGSALLFQLENAGNFWPVGDYQVNIYLNEVLYQEIPFTVHDTDVH